MMPSNLNPHDFDLPRLQALLPADWQLHYFAEIGSTNDWALERFRAEPATGPAFILARLQSRGRGRADRSWQAAAGNLTCSLAFPLLAPDSSSAGDPHASQLPWPARIAIGTALAVWETAQDFLPESRCQIKWPNDLLIDQRKAAGILIESCLGKAPGREPNPLQTVVVGIGINVNANPPAEPTSAPERRGLEPISFAASAGRLFDLTTVVAALANHLAERLAVTGIGHQFGREAPSADRKLLEQFNAQLAWRGASVSIRQGGEESQGVLEGLDQNGRLLLSTSAGLRAFAAGELRPLS